MSRAVIWSRPAARDLMEAFRFIAQDNPDAATRVTSAIRLVGTRLGVQGTGRPGRVTGTYEKSVPGRPYVIAYALRGRDDGQIVEILRVIHTAPNWPERGWPKG